MMEATILILCSVNTSLLILLVTWCLRGDR